MLRKLCIFGVGLIGGSLSLALRRAGYCREVVGCSRSEGHLSRAVELNVIDSYSLDPAEAVQDADMVLLAVPLGAMAPVCESIRHSLAPDAVLTDVGSAKASVVRAVTGAFGEAPAGFVPGHPIAGNEQSGVEAAFPELFQGRRVILTPLANTREDARDKVRTMWEVAGAVVEEMGVEHHDEVLAATSHLPHLLAFGLVDSLARMGEREEIFHYAAGGFRDFTRIASSDPVMWRDICLANSEAILTVMTHYQQDLDSITRAVQEGDGERLLEIFQRAKAARDRFCH
ncbi:MAG TPA: prephenate dehydrogenase/arogenate dehydrogenase family protein [Thioalkalivibrio sp.]|nr:prephenate dehydrogenase/arogenate dehydrogenase family protein [Thioalkalivibrio sp.]